MAFVQYVAASADGSGPTLTLDVTVSAGNTLALFSHSQNEFTSIASVSDGHNTWVPKESDYANNFGISGAYALNIAAGSYTITATMSGSVTKGRLFAVEYSGVATSGALETSDSAGTEGGTTVSTLPVGGASPADDTTADGDLIVSFSTCELDSRTLVVPSQMGGFTQRGTTTGLGNGSVMIADATQATHGTVSLSWTVTGGNDSMAAIYLAFKVSGGGGSSDVLIRYGNVAQTQGSGLLTAPFATSAVATLGGGAYYLRRRRHEDTVTWDDL